MPNQLSTMNIRVLLGILMLSSFFIASCKKTQPVKVVAIDTPRFRNVLIFGNSITWAPQDLSIGWTGSWGMAATAADSDYVHQLTAKLKKINPDCTVTTVSSYNWELNYDTPGVYDIPTNLASYKALNPDLVIFRIGEDVMQTPLDTADFGAHYRALLTYLNQGETMLAVGSFWPRPVTDEVMKRNSPNFITLSSIGNDYSTYSFGAWTDPGLQQHPNNKGHRLIADSIWKAILQLKVKKS